MPPAAPRPRRTPRPRRPRRPRRRPPRTRCRPWRRSRRRPPRRRRRRCRPAPRGRPGREGGTEGLAEAAAAAGDHRHLAPMDVFGRRSPPAVSPCHPGRRAPVTGPARPGRGARGRRRRPRPRPAANTGPGRPAAAGSPRQRPVGRVDRDRLGGPHRHRRARGDLRRKLERRGERLPVVDQAVDQAEVLGASRVERCPGANELHRHRLRETARQPEHAAAARGKPAAHLRQAEPGALARGDHVAGEHDLEPAAERPAFHRGDQRLGRRPLDNAAEAPRGVPDLLPGREHLQVHARAEGGARAVQHADPQFGRAVEQVERAGDAGRDRAVDGVALLRPVDGDDQDAVFAADQNVVGRSRSAGG